MRHMPHVAHVALRDDRIRESVVRGPRPEAHSQGSGKIVAWRACLALTPNRRPTRDARPPPPARRRRAARGSLARRGQGPSTRARAPTSTENRDGARRGTADDCVHERTPRVCAGTARERAIFGTVQCRKLALDLRNEGGRETAAAGGGDRPARPRARDGAGRARACTLDEKREGSRANQRNGPTDAHAIAVSSEGARRQSARSLGLFVLDGFLFLHRNCERGCMS